MDAGWVRADEIGVAEALPGIVKTHAGEVNAIHGGKVSRTTV